MTGGQTLIKHYKGKLGAMAPKESRTNRGEHAAGRETPTFEQQEEEEFGRAYRHRNAVDILMLGWDTRRTALPELAAFAYPTTKTTASSVQVILRAILSDRCTCNRSVHTAVKADHAAGDPGKAGACVYTLRLTQAVPQQL